MKRRNRESRARMQIIQERHMDKDAQRKLDLTKRLTGVSYVKLLELYRALNRIRASFLAFQIQLAKVLEPAIRNLTSAAQRWMEEA